MIVRFNSIEIQLSDWKAFGQDNYLWNFYRSSDSDIIGFVVNCGDTFIKDPNLATWKIYTNGYSKLAILRNLYIKIYGNNSISFKDLNLAKENLDHILLKYDSLKAFL